MLTIWIVIQLIAIGVSSFFWLLISAGSDRAFAGAVNYDESYFGSRHQKERSRGARNKHNIVFGIETEKLLRDYQNDQDFAT